MLTDIFSSFDPGTSSLFTSLPSPLFWSLNIFFLTTLLSTFWASPSNMSFILSFPKTIMHSQSSSTTGAHISGFSSIVSALFISIIIFNLTGLLPYVFSTTSHLFFCLAVGLPMWLSLVMSSFTKSPTSFLAGLLPGGAPDWLNPILVLVESISILIRPVTLSFRLVANMSAGHIFLGLMGIYATTAMFTSLSGFSTLIFLQTFYTLFEVAICLIQAYIFCLLLTMYADDHTS